MTSNKKRILVFIILILCSILGLEPAKYLLVLYFFTVFIGEVGAVCFGLIFLIFVPFMVFFNETALAEALAVSSFIMFSAFVCRKVGTWDASFERILAPIKDKAVNNISVSVFAVLVFCLNVFSKAK